MNGCRDRLWLALRMQDLPLSALEIEGVSENPTVVVEKQRVIYANPAAVAAGAAEGMDVTTAQVISACSAIARDRAREEIVLHHLCESLYQFTPHIDVYRSRDSLHSGLRLEISTCLKLFGGSVSLVQQIMGCVSTTPHTATCGLGHTSDAAWLLSFQPEPVTGAETVEDFIARLHRLPIHVLVDYPKAVEALDRTGFSTLGDIATQTRSSTLASFTKRVGREFAEHISNIYGREYDLSQGSLFAKPIITYKPDETFMAEVPFEYPVSVVDQLHPAIENLLQQLADYLRQRQLECQRIEWQLSDIYRRKEIVEIHSDVPQSHWQLLFDLTRIQLESKELPFEVDCLRLTCDDLLPIQSRTQTIDFAQGRKRRASEQDLAVTIAKLKARLGDAAVYKVSCKDGHVPELTNDIINVAQKSCQQLPELHQYALRPTWLLSPPEPIETRGTRLYWQGYLTIVVGPDRITGEWWEDSIVRDYFLARRHDNVPLWIYRDLHSKAWFVHGVFA